MNSTPEISLIDLFLTLPDKRSDSAPRRMSPRTLDRAVNWIAGHAEHNVHLVFRGSENPLSEPYLIERAVSQCRKWEACHPVQFTLTIVIHSRNLDELFAAKLAARNAEYLLSSDAYETVHHGFREAERSEYTEYTDRSSDIMRTRLSITPEGQVFACPPMTRLPEQDGLLLGDVFKGFLRVSQKYIPLTSSFCSSW